MPNTKRVDDIIKNFAEQLQAAMREQLSEEVTMAVQAALGGSEPKRGRPAANGKGAAGRRTGAKPKRLAKAGKRSPEEIDKLEAQLLSYIEKNPDQRSEQISAGVKVTTGELVLPFKRLLAEKKIKAKGKARGTTYAATK